MLPIHATRNARTLCTTLLQMNRGAAQDHASKLGIETRICFMDGKAYACTRDYKPARVNLRIENDKVTEAWVG